MAAGWFAESLGSGLSLTLGLEEELILVDPLSLLPVDAVEWVLTRTRGDPRFSAELRACQVEARTPICPTAADARDELARARRRLVSLLADRVRLMGVA